MSSIPGYDAWKTATPPEHEGPEHEECAHGIRVNEHCQDCEDEAPESCQSCGRLIFDDTDGYDDVASAPYVTESGDLYCIPCGRQHDEAQREQDERDAVDWMDDPYEARS